MTEKCLSELILSVKGNKTQRFKILFQIQTFQQIVFVFKRQFFFTSYVHYKIVISRMIEFLKIRLQSCKIGCNNLFFFKFSTPNALHHTNKYTMRVTCRPSLTGVLHGCGRGEAGVITEGVGGGVQSLLITPRQNQHLGKKHRDQH